MGRINKYRKLALNEISITYGGEKISFNLMQELSINETTLNDQIRTQPSKYGFLLLLHKKLLTQFETLKQRRKKTYGKLYHQAKETKGDNGRFMSDDLAKAWVESHKLYMDITDKCIKAKDDADTIYSCVKALEQRASLIQSLSSNIRNER